MKSLSSIYFRSKSLLS